MLQMQENLFASCEIHSTQEFTGGIRKALQGWRFTAHPLRELNLAAVNEEYARKLCGQAELPDFASGRLKSALVKTKDGIWFWGIRKLVWDTDFFGFPIGRLEPLLHPHPYEVSTDLFKTAVEIVKSAITVSREQGLIHLTASADPSDAISIYALEENGFRLKDTMNYHVFDTSKMDLELEEKRARLAQPEDLPHLEKINLDCFANRHLITNRFNSDPQYKPELISKMYKVWIDNSFEGKSCDVIFVADHDGVPAGYLTGILPTPEQIELGIPFGDMGVGAVSPEHHGKGCFRIVHKELLCWFKEQGIRYVLTRTALSTYGVNKNCSKHGSAIVCSPHTFHLNLLEH
jgi:GNAT superfamily N-acetyltransferase